MKVNRDNPTFGYLPIGFSLMTGALTGVACMNAPAGSAAALFCLLLCFLADEIIVAIMESRPDREQG